MNGAIAAQNAPTRKERPGQSSKLRMLAECLVVAICTLSFVFTVLSIGAGLMGRHAPGTRDYVEYWAAGQQLAHHANPYDAGAILRIERGVGFPPDVPPLVVPNPPTALPLVFALGFFSARSGEMLWLLLLLASFIVSVRLVRALHGAPSNKLHYFGYAFAPALVCLAANQASMFVLLGLALFLRFHRTRPFVAGAALWFCLLKPHLFVPFGLVLLLWIVATKCYKVMAGTACAVAFSAAVAFVIDPSAWTQYLQMMRLARVDKVAIPSLSNVLRRGVSADTMWLQYLPVAVGCIWALAYFWRHRRDWDWLQHGSLLMLVSVLAAPYTWIIDQTILVPAILHGVYVTRSRILLATLALASAVIEIAPHRGMELMHSPFYLWTTPVWLAWYLLATRSGHGGARHRFRQ